MKQLLDRISQALTDLRDFARHEPVITRAAVVGAVGLAARFGLELDADQVLAVVLGTGAVATVLARRKVTPEADLLDPHA